MASLKEIYKKHFTSQKVLTGVGKPSFLDAFVPFVGSFVFLMMPFAGYFIFLITKDIIFSIPFSWHEILGGWEMLVGLSTVEAAMYGIICYIVFIVFIRTLYTPLFFMIVSVILTSYPFWLYNMTSCGNAPCAIHWIYVTTITGYFFSIINPLAVMAIYSVYVFIKNLKHKKVTL